MRRLLATSTPPAPWLETREAFAGRLREVARRVNEQHNVAGLCHELPTRLSEVVLKEGDRLRK